MLHVILTNHARWARPGRARGLLARESGLRRRQAAEAPELAEHIQYKHENTGAAQGTQKKRPVEDMTLTRLEFWALDPFFSSLFL